MHQYHLGQHEEEKEGELVVSKIFYQTQPRQCNWSDRSATTGEGSGEPNNNSTGRRDSGSGSCSSKEIVTHRDEMSAVVGVPPMTGFTTHHPLDIQQLKPLMRYIYTTTNFYAYGYYCDYFYAYG